MDSPIQLSFELLTPAFLGGATPRRIDPYMPLRPSAVRGALRAWFRIAAASVLWPTEDTPQARGRMIDDLRTLEQRLFGSTRSASPIAVLPAEGGSILHYAREGVPDAKQWPGLRYLGFGLFDGGAPEALVTDGQSPRIDLRLRFRRDVTPELRRLIGAAAWLWVHFGGLGARSRRGFGSMRLVAQEGIDAPRDLLRQPADRKQLIDKLLQGLDWVTEVCKEALPRLTTHPLLTGAGPHLELRTLDGIGTVTVLPPDCPSPLEALDRAGRHFRNFRSTLQRNSLGLPPLPDYHAVKAAIQRNAAPGTVERAAFGLPLPFYFRSLGGAKATILPDEGDRLASPLHFRVHALGPPGAAPRHAVVLYNMAEANGALPLVGRSLVQRGARKKSAAPDGHIIQQCIQWMLQEALRSPQARVEGKR
ncbi:MAG: hypothetical protein IT372_03605 [Polyangiaceae bacterium]|nr:hypothetical protein [Polyangiaceae bacterium]